MAPLHICHTAMYMIDTTTFACLCREVDAAVLVNCNDLFSCCNMCRIYKHNLSKYLTAVYASCCFVKSCGYTTLSRRVA
eukprot:3086-Heterococcus_DN1.PRE.4